MRLSSQSSQFIFNLPTDFINKEVVKKYQPILDLYHMQYDTIIDYLNSTIKSITCPGISIETPNQSLMHGKKRDFRPATSAFDIVSTRELTITFRSVDADVNYMIIYDSFFNYYISDPAFLSPVVLTTLTYNRDALFETTYTEIIMTSLSENMYSYSQQKINEKEFTLTLKFNFMDIKLLLDNTKVLDFDGNPKIITK